MGTTQRKSLDEKNGCVVYDIILTIVVGTSAISVVRRGVRRR